MSRYCKAIRAHLNIKKPIRKRAGFFIFFKVRKKLTGDLHEGGEHYHHKSAQRHANKSCPEDRIEIFAVF
jgi:tRNA(Leu) C34 or U34 (ribose-2'-O)-methylase TrmL